MPGGETEGRRRMQRWLGDEVDSYTDHQDDLAADATSRLSPYLHFGCLSPVEPSWCSARDAGGLAGCDDQALAAGKEGRTGYPIVDAGMRRLAVEGWMHNRERLVDLSEATERFRAARGNGWHADRAGARCG